VSDEIIGSAYAPAKGQYVRLTRLQLKGFRSIAAEDIAFTTVNALIGPNGAGKSNLIAFLRMLAYMLSGDQGLSRYVAQLGGATEILHYGPKVTPRMWACLTLETEQGVNDYEFTLAYASGDRLYFDMERCRFSAKGKSINNKWIDFGAGHNSPGLLHTPEATALKTQKTILTLLRGLHVYQFHDTSRLAKLKQGSFESDNRFLRDDAGNIAAFLLRLREKYFVYYRRIIEVLKQIAPFFEDFILESEGGKVLLRWADDCGDYIFGPDQMSDGTIRAVALLTLLLQPPELLPAMIVIDEPELGLHPFAVRVVAALVRAAASERQCLVATQSPEFLNEFDIEEVIIVDRIGDSSSLRRLSAPEFEIWLDDYTLGELWDMNLLGGRPNAATSKS